jgi:hypothetical protein
MKNILHKIKQEFLKVLPPTIFFFFAFNIVAITTVLMLKGQGIEITSILGATILALVVGKVVLIADHMPFINKFPDKPLIYNIVWKTFIYQPVSGGRLRQCQREEPLDGSSHDPRSAIGDRP